MLGLSRFRSCLEAYKNITATLVAVFVCVVAVLFTQGRYLSQAWQARTIPIDAWNVFHYYLNTKYFSELGYLDLYSCALLADRKAGKLIQGEFLVRDLRTYAPQSSQQLVACPRERFTVERWQSFVQDLSAIQGYRTYLPVFYEGRLEKYWQSILTDKGYNLTPFGTTIYGSLARFLSFEHAWQGSVLILLDVFFLTVAFGLVWWAFGRRATFGALLAVLLFWGTQDFLFGLYLQHVWFALFLAALAFYEKGWLKMSAFAFAVTILLRIFPAFFLLGLVAKGMQAWKADKKIFEQKYAPFFLILTISLGAGFIISLANGHAWMGWIEFFHKMNQHARYLIGELFNLGFKNWIGTMAGSYGSPEHRILFFQAWRSMYFLLGIGALWVFVKYVIRKTDIEAIIYSLIPVYLFVVLSPYYYLTLCLPFLLLDKPSSSSHVLLWTGVTVLLLMHLILAYGGFIYYSTDFRLHFLSESFFLLLWGVFLLSLVFSHLASSRAKI